MLTLSRECSPRKHIGMGRQRWTKVRAHVHLSSIGRYHLGGRNHLSDEGKALKSLSRHDIKSCNNCCFVM